MSSQGVSNTGNIQCMVYTTGTWRDTKDLVPFRRETDSLVPESEQSLYQTTSETILASSQPWYDLSYVERKSQLLKLSTLDIQWSKYISKSHQNEESYSSLKRQLERIIVSSVGSSFPPSPKGCCHTMIVIAAAISPADLLSAVLSRLSAGLSCTVVIVSSSPMTSTSLDSLKLCIDIINNPSNGSLCGALSSLVLPGISNLTTYITQPLALPYLSHLYFVGHRDLSQLLYSQLIASPGTSHIVYASHHISHIPLVVYERADLDLASRSIMALLSAQQASPLVSGSLVSTNPFYGISFFSLFVQESILDQFIALLQHLSPLLRNPTSHLDTSQLDHDLIRVYLSYMSSYGSNITAISSSQSSSDHVYQEHTRLLNKIIHPQSTIDNDNNNGGKCDIPETIPYIIAYPLQLTSLPSHGSTYLLPVIPMTTFRTLSESLLLINTSTYSLGAFIYNNNTSGSIEISHLVQHTNVYLNWDICNLQSLYESSSYNNNHYISCKESSIRTGIHHTHTLYNIISQSCGQFGISHDTLDASTILSTIPSQTSNTSISSRISIVSPTSSSYLSTYPQTIPFPKPSSTTFPSIPSSTCSTLSSLSSPPVDATIKLYINGKQQRSDGESVYTLHVDTSILHKQFPSTMQSSSSSYTRSQHHIPACNRKDIRDAVESSRIALHQGKWSIRQPTSYNKSQILYFLAENLYQRREEYACLILAQYTTTHPIKYPSFMATRQYALAEIDAAINAIFTAAASTDKYGGSVQTNALHDDTFVYTCTQHHGVVALICDSVQQNNINNDDNQHYTDHDISSAMSTSFLAFITMLMPLISRGNTVVAVPPSQCLAALLFYQVLETSDIPSGVINIISGDAASLAQFLALHREVSAIYGVVSQSLHTSISQACVDTCKPCFAFTPNHLMLYSTHKSHTVDLATNNPWITSSAILLSLFTLYAIVPKRIHISKPAYELPLPDPLTPFIDDVSSSSQ